MRQGQLAARNVLTKFNRSNDSKSSSADLLDGHGRRMPTGVIDNAVEAAEPRHAGVDQACISAGFDTSVGTNLAS